MTSLFLCLAFLSLIVTPALLALLTPSAADEGARRREFRSTARVAQDQQAL